MAMIIDGKAQAQSLRTQLGSEVAAFKTRHGVAPGLAVLLVGNNPASEIYVRNKSAMCREIGMNSFDIPLPSVTTQAELLARIEALNHDDAVHGILVQLPLPAHINEYAVINAVHPDKDVDGFHVVNAGKLMTGQDSLVPCTPQGCVLLIKHAMKKSLAGQHAIIIGRSNIVGKPVAQLLLKEHCTVTIAHSRSKHLQALSATADIVVAAVGKPEMVRGEWIKEGAIVIDVGINRVTLSDGSKKIVGDVAFAEAAQRARAITPVPGGVGPMTIACLLANTLKAAQRLVGESHLVRDDLIKT